jgi:ankyrin repeat protein
MCLFVNKRDNGPFSFHQPKAALSWVDRQKSGADATAEELIVASEEGDAPTVASALRNPLVDPNMVDDAGWPPLINATIGNHAAVVALLVADQRVNPNLKNPKGDTALILAGKLILNSHTYTTYPVPEEYAAPVT